MSVRTVVVRLRADIEEFRRGFDEAGSLVEKQKEAMDKLGKGGMVAGGLLAAGLVLSAKAAIEWETAFAGVTKTVDASAEQMAVLEGELRGLATTLPASATEIAGVAEAAGQLGVKREDIVAFTKTMVDLGETTNLTSEEAATSLARFSNIMGITGDDIDRLGSTLVALGNDGASTEAEIAEMGLRIAGAGKQIGLSGADVLGFANALSSVGVEAEAGGTAISRVMIDIAQAVEMGGEKLDLFAQVAGVSTAQFRQQFGEDAAGGVNLFIDGLGRMNAAGESTFGVLEQLNLNEIRVRDALLRLSNAQGLATESTKLGNEAWAANTALVDEANKRYETTESKLKVARNSINEVAITLGSILLPAIAAAAEGVAGLAQFLADLPGWLQAVLVGLAGVAATIGLVGGAALITAAKIDTLAVSMLALGFSNSAVIRSFALLSTALKGAGILAAIAAAVYAVKTLADASIEAAPDVDKLRGSIVDFAKEGKATGDLLSVVGEDFASMAKTVTDANRSKWFTWDSYADVEKARRDLGALDEALTAMVAAGQGDVAAEIFGRMAAEVEKGGGKVSELNESMGLYGEALRKNAADSKVAAAGAGQLAEKYGELGPQLGTAYDSMESFIEVTGMSEDATKDLMKRVDAWAQSLAGFVQPLGAYTDLLEQMTDAERENAEKGAEAQNEGVDKKIKAVQREYEARLSKMKDTKGISDEAIQKVEDERDRTVDALDKTKKGWEDYTKGVTVSVQAYLGELEKQVAAQETWQANMLHLSARVSQGTLDELARMGPEGAPLVAQLVNASDGELARMDDLFARRTSDATGAMAAELYLANTLLPRIAAKVGEGVAFELASKLAAGTTTVSQIFKDYANVMTDGVNPILTSLGKGPINAGFTRGGTTKYADGGIEDHVAQIAQGGPIRVWAEPETGGEAYIPLADSKTARSRDIWEEVGRRKGWGRFEEFATGGFHMPGDVPRPSSTAPYGVPISTVGDASMEKIYGEAVDFVTQRAAPALGAGIGWQAMMAALRGRFPGLPLNSGFRPGSITATGNPSYHGMGRAVDVPPRMDVNKWIAENYRSQTRELIFSAAGATQLRNGAPHAYTGITRAMHFDHNHWAMAKGGILNPYVRDQGGPLMPGYTLNGTGRPETVVPTAAAAVQHRTVNLTQNVYPTVGADVDLMMRQAEFSVMTSGF